MYRQWRGLELLPQNETASRGSASSRICQKGRGSAESCFRALRCTKQSPDEPRAWPKGQLLQKSCRCSKSFLDGDRLKELSCDKLCYTTIKPVWPPITPQFHVVVSVCKAALGWLHSHGVFILSFCVIILQEKRWELNAC